MLYIYILNSIPAFFLDQPCRKAGSDCGIHFALPQKKPDGFHGGISQSELFAKSQMRIPMISATRMKPKMNIQSCRARATRK
jgi:hypothetical protein